jgi:hypothetical protein
MGQIVIADNVVRTKHAEIHYVDDVAVGSGGGNGGNGFPITDS